MRNPKDMSRCGVRGGKRGLGRFMVFHKKYGNPYIALVPGIDLSFCEGKSEERNDIDWMDVGDSSYVKGTGKVNDHSIRIGSDDIHSLD